MQKIRFWKLKSLLEVEALLFGLQTVFLFLIRTTYNRFASFWENGFKSKAIYWIRINFTAIVVIQKFVVIFQTICIPIEPSKSVEDSKYSKDRKRFYCSASFQFWPALNTALFLHSHIQTQPHSSISFTKRMQFESHKKQQAIKKNKSKKNK